MYSMWLFCVTPLNWTIGICFWLANDGVPQKQPASLGGPCCDTRSDDSPTHHLISCYSSSQVRTKRLTYHEWILKSKTEPKEKVENKVWWSARKIMFDLCQRVKTYHLSFWEMNSQTTNYAVKASSLGKSGFLDSSPYQKPQLNRPNSVLNLICGCSWISSKVNPKTDRNL